MRRDSLDMHKKNRKFLKNPWLKWVVLPFILLCFWLVSSLLFASSSSFSALRIVISKNNFINPYYGKLYRGNIIHGVFIAEENNLGIVDVRIKTFSHVDYADEDVLRFRIRRQGSQTWYASNTYKSGQMYELPFFPFGFPIISHSKGQPFEFEITSLKGNNDNAVAISEDEPVLAAEYIFSKSELFADKRLLPNFLYKKFVTSFTSTVFLFSSLLYLIPFIFYLLWQVFSKFVLFSSHIPVACGIYLVIILNAFFPRQNIPGITFILIGIWFIYVFVYKLPSISSFFSGMAFFFSSILAVILQDQPLASRLSDWIYFFLVIGIIQVILEMKENEKFK